MAAGRSGRKVDFVLICLLAFFFLVLVDMGWSFTQGPNNRNVTVDTRVNVTGNAPDILTVLVDNPVTLGAGAITTVTCNVSVRDYNGFADIYRVNASLFYNATSPIQSADDNNTHYTNSSCSAISGQQAGINANYTCTFPVNYYAVNGTWNCTAFANDSINLVDQGSNLTNFSALLAINVTQLVNYGDMAMGSTSTDQQANITNLGNWNISVRVRGYGRTLDDGWSFVCDQGNLTVDLEHFSADSGVAYNSKQTLASAYSTITNVRIPKSINATQTQNITYWQLFLNTSQNVYGQCNGSLVFQAEA